MHIALQVVELAQESPPAQGVETLEQLPDPSQTGVVRSPLAHDTAPHEVPLAAKTHAPPALQSLAPQGPVELHNAAQQCVPTPRVPQRLPTHWSFALHIAPAPRFGTQLPASQKSPLVWQSLSDAHMILHAVALAQGRFPGHAVGAPGLHVPEPLQVLRVSCPFTHDDPHAVPLVGKTHAPLLLQSVAPQAPPTELQVLLQQRVPVPLVPQIPLAHWSGATHVTPAPPLGTQTPDVPGFKQ
jgi:hypothetical protein